MGSRARWWFVVWCGTAFVLTSAPAAAQGIARSFYQLQVLVRPGDTVRVVGPSGREVRGRIDRITDSSLTLLVQSRPEEFTEAQVARILQRRSDSLANGALWGLGIGAGLIGVAGLIEPPQRGEGGFFALALLIYAGVGAGIGTGVDAMIRREQVIFERLPGARFTRMGLVPIVGHGRKGVALSFRF